jgi:hypothetical protein
MLSFDDFTIYEMADQQRGICQVCGREQAVRGAGNITHHGYTIKDGWFAGACPGQQHRPLQHDKSVTEHHIDAITKEIPQLEKRHEALTAGDLHPTHVRVKSYPKPEFVEWDQADDSQKRRAQEIAIHDNRNRIRQGRDTVAMLQGLIGTYHGKELKTVSVETQRRPGIGDTVDISPHKGVKIKDIQDRRVQGIGPKINGSILPHAIFDHPVTGKERATPMRFVRWPKDKT